MTLEKHSDIKIDNITILDNGSIGNSVADDFVQGDTTRFGETLVIQR
jgi:hypothetical protein